MRRNILLLTVILVITLFSHCFLSSEELINHNTTYEERYILSSNNLQLIYYIDYYDHDGFRNLTCRDEQHPCSNTDQVINSAKLELFKIVNENNGKLLDSFSMIIMFQSAGQCSSQVFDFSNYTKQFDMVWKGQKRFDSCPGILPSASVVNEFTVENGNLLGELYIRNGCKKLLFEDCRVNTFFNLNTKVDEMIISDCYFSNNVEISHVENLIIKNSVLIVANLVLYDRANVLIENSIVQGTFNLENFDSFVIRNSTWTQNDITIDFTSKVNLGGEIIFSNVVTNAKLIIMSVKNVIMDRVTIHDTDNIYYLYQIISVSEIKFIDCSIKNNRMKHNFNLISMKMVKQLSVENCKICNNRGSFLSFSDTNFGQTPIIHVKNGLFEDNTLDNASLFEFLDEPWRALSVCFKNSTFIGNKGGNMGSAIHIEGGYLELVDSQFISNNSTYGGAVNTKRAVLKICNSKFLNNTGEKGGALYIDSSTYGYSTFICENNTASYAGGCIYSENCDISPISSIRNNKAKYYGPDLASQIVDLDIMVEDVGSSSEIEILAGQSFELILYPKDIYNQSTSQLIENNLIIRPTNAGDCTFLHENYYFNHTIPIFIQIFPSQMLQPFKISFVITPNIEKQITVKILPCPWSYSLKHSEKGYSCDYVPLVIIIPSAILIFTSLLIIIGFIIYCCGMMTKKLLKLRKQERAEQEIEKKFKSKEFIFEETPLLPSNFNSINSRKSIAISEKKQYLIPISEIDILKRIAEGANGIVFYGKWNRTDVAIKQLKTDSNDEEFENEALLMSSLRHPSIVNIYGVSLTTNGKYMIVEFLENGSLDGKIYLSKIGKEILRFETKLKILIDISKGLVYLHSIKPHRIIHRDLKPGNILLDRNMNAKVGDFGLSKIVSNNSATLTANIGTLLYMAPELLSNDYKGRDSVDTFSFGIIMWEILLETSPYANEIDESTNIFQILTKVTKGHRPSLALFEESLDSKEVDDWIEHNFKKKQINSIGKSKILQLVNSYLEIMKSCWANDPSQRPEFIEITDQLEMLQNYLE